MEKGEFEALAGDLGCVEGCSIVGVEEGKACAVVVDVDDLDWKCHVE